MQTSQYSTILQEMKDVLQQSPPRQVNLTTNQSASATSTVSLAALLKLHLDGNSSPEKRKKFITELFQSVVEVVPDDKLEEITAKLMHLSDSMSNTKSTHWSFSMSPTNASNSLSQMFFTPEGDLVDLNESDDFVPKKHLSNYHVPKIGYLMLQRYSNFSAKHHKAYFASMHDVSLKTADLSPNIEMQDAAKSGSSNKEHTIDEDDNACSLIDEADDDNKQVPNENTNSEGNPKVHNEEEEIKEAIDSLVNNLKEELGECDYEQSDLSYVLIPISVCKYHDPYNRISLCQTSSILMSIAT